MYIQLKTGYDTDRGPAWIARIRFTKSWRTAYFHEHVLRRVTGTANANLDSNFYDVETGEEYWISGPKRDQSDARFSSQKPSVEDDAREDYSAFLQGSPFRAANAGDRADPPGLPAAEGQPSLNLVPSLAVYVSTQL